MRQFPSIASFVAHLATLPAVMHHAQREGEEAAGRVLVRETKAIIGTERDEWPALAESTVAQKQARGQTGRVSATDPLLATGAMRDTIDATVDQTGVTLGSTSPLAPFHEFGTGRIPARPFIGPTMFRHGHAAAETIAHHVVAAVAGDRKPPARQS